MNALYPLTEGMHEQNNSFSFLMVKSESSKHSDQEDRVYVGHVLTLDILTRQATLFLTSMRLKQQDSVVKIHPTYLLFSTNLDCNKEESIIPVIATVENTSI